MNHREFRTKRREIDATLVAVSVLSGVHYTTISRFEKHGILLRAEQIENLEKALVKIEAVALSKQPVCPHCGGKL